MMLSDKWVDYELIDAGDGEKLERWGEYILRRPDPQSIWPKNDEVDWEDFHAIYIRSTSGGGNWKYKKNIPYKWQIKYNELIFNIQLTGFKHTGLFPEQASNWDWMINKIKESNQENNVLNLFAYTGGASLACSYAGASVCHVDASKGMVQKAKENLEVSGLAANPVRFIVDDVFKFISREIRRGNKYEGIVMDPPSYGRGPKGELWKIEDEIFNLTKMCAELLSDKALFFIINSYTTGLSPMATLNILKLALPKDATGKLTCSEIGIPTSSRKIVLPCGSVTRWESC